jgi:hypothetical protein
MEDFELEYEDDDYLSQFIDEEEIKKVGKIIEEEELEDEEVEEVAEWFTPDFKQALEESRYKTRSKSFRSSGSFTDDIIQKESGGNYKATNPNSSAAGKYQFLWNTWGNKIADFTGVQSKQEFLNNPQAQDSFYNDYYLPQELLPAVKRLKSKGFNMDTDTLAKLVHFRGEQGAYDYLTGRVGDKPENYNMSISQYIKQTGGYAQTGGDNRLDFGNLEYLQSKRFDGYSPVNPQYQTIQNIKTPDEEPSPNTGEPISSVIMKGIQERDDLLSSGIDAFKQVNEVKRDVKDFTARTISKGTSLANIALNSQEAKRKRLEQMDLQNMEFDIYNPNSNNQFKLKSVL